MRSPVSVIAGVVVLAALVAAVIITVVVFDGNNQAMVVGSIVAIVAPTITSLLALLNIDSAAKGVNTINKRTENIERNVNGGTTVEEREKS